MTLNQISKLKKGTALIYAGAGLHFECTLKEVMWGSVHVMVTRNIGSPNRTLAPGYTASVGTTSNLKLKKEIKTPNEFKAKNGQIIRTKITHVF